MAVAASLRTCEAQGVPQMLGALWPVLKGAIERDPTQAVQALQISDEAIRATNTEMETYRFAPKTYRFP
jgi:hypothetical protein